jgi:hypothetical protein
MGKKKTIEKLENIENPTVSTDCIDDNEPLQAEKIPQKPISESIPPTPPTPPTTPEPKPKRKQTDAQKETTVKMR